METIPGIAATKATTVRMAADDSTNDGPGGVLGAGGVLGLSPVSESDEADLVGNWGDKD